MKKYWNYRVIKRTQTFKNKTYVSYAIHEVHYKDSKPVMISSNSIEPYGEDLTELKKSFEYMNEAFNKPVINYEDIAGCRYGDDDE